MSNDAQTVPTAWSAPEWTITDRLRKAREAAGMNQKQLADATGIGLRTINNYENPAYTTERKRSFIASWAWATGAPFSWLAYGEEPVQNGPDGTSDLGVSPSACTADVIDLATRRIGHNVTPAVAA